MNYLQVKKEWREEKPRQLGASSLSTSLLTQPDQTIPTQGLMKETILWFLFKFFCKLKPSSQFSKESPILEISVGKAHGLGGETEKGQKNGGAGVGVGWGGRNLHRVRKKTGKGRSEHLQHLVFPGSPFPQLRRQIYSPGLGRGGG